MNGHGRDDDGFDEDDGDEPWFRTRGTEESPSPGIGRDYASPEQLVVSLVKSLALIALVIVTIGVVGILIEVALQPAT